MGTPRHDFTGKDVGHWKVISYINGGKWKLENKITGETKEVNTQTVRQALSTGHGIRSVKDYTGKQLGEAKVIGSTGERKSLRKEKVPTWIVEYPDGTIGVSSSNVICSSDITGYRKSEKGRQKSRLSMNKLNENRDKYLEKRGYKDGTTTWAKNMKTPSSNTSGHKGVRLYKKSPGRRKTDKWGAFIYFKGKQIYLGTFDTKEEAIVAREKAEQKYFN